jgi:hypothetical protein
LNSPTKAESNGWSVYTPVSVYCTLRYTCGTCRLTSDSKYYCANIISSGNDVDAATGATNLNPVSNCNVQSANTCN